MSTKNDFTPDEWKLLVGLPWAVGLSVILAEDQGGRGATKKELAVLAAAPAQVAANFAGNTLVQAATPEITANAASELVTEHSHEKGAVEQAIFKSTIDLCKRTGALLDAKTNYDEGDGYKRFVIGIGRAVAGAAADAEYLGIGGGTISAYERRLLQAASDALSLEEE